MRKRQPPKPEPKPFTPRPTDAWHGHGGRYVYNPQTGRREPAPAPDSTPKE